MTILLIALMIIGGFLLDAAILPQLAVLGVVPDILICITVSFALLYGCYIGASVGVAGGLMLDILVGHALGFYALIHLLIGVGAGFLSGNRSADRYLFPSSIAALAVVIKAFYCILYLVITGHGGESFVLFWRYSFPGAILSGLIMVPVHLLIRTRKMFKSLKRNKLQNYYE